MRRRRDLPTLLLILVLAATGACAEGGGVIAEGRAAGPARLGARPASVVSAWGAPRRRLADEKPPADRSPRYYFEYPEEGLWLLVQDDRIVKIGVESGTWKTARGAVLYATVDQVQKLYGRGHRRLPEGYDPQKPTSIPRYFLEYPALGIDFLIQERSRLVEAIHIYPPRR